VNIDNAVKEGDKQLLSGYQESLSRFAQRNNIAINFNNAENQTQMNVFKTSLTPHAIKRKEQGFWYFATPEYKASVPLPKENINTDFYKNLKNTIKELVNTTKESDTKQRYPLRIRHENKYNEPMRVKD
jgi:hypothetical protein